MNVWVIKDGENLPVQPNARKMRTWMIAEELLQRDHSVTWWASTFSHQRKKLLFDHDVRFKITSKFNMELLYAGRYKSNFSLIRYLHHRKLANKLSHCIRRVTPPDIIVCSFPIIHVAYEAVIYANINNIPIIIDVRDLWPDTILYKIPEFLKPLGRCFLKGDFVRTEKILKKADSLIAVSSGFLHWALKYAGRPSCNDDKVFYIGYPVKGLTINDQADFIQKFKFLNEGKKIFTFVGSFGFTYELQLLCYVGKMLADQGIDNIHFAIAGDGEQFENIFKLAKNLLNFSLFGWINKDEIQQLLSVSHVGLVPYKNVVNMMPNKPFEYFSYGLPILSSLEGEMEDLINDYDVGFSYKPGDVHALYEHILRFAQDEPLRKRFGLNAKKLFENKFRADIIYSDYADHIEHLAVKKRRLR